MPYEISSICLRNSPARSSAPPRGSHLLGVPVRQLRGRGSRAALQNPTGKCVNKTRENHGKTSGKSWENSVTQVIVFDKTRDKWRRMQQNLVIFSVKTATIGLKILKGIHGVNVRDLGSKEHWNLTTEHWGLNKARSRSWTACQAQETDVHPIHTGISPVKRNGRWWTNY